MQEFELIRRITDSLPQGEQVVLGPGDDAAVLRFEGESVVTTDILVEDVHFRRAWAEAHQIGRKAVAVNISDVEAMGARPVAVVVALAVPGELRDEWVPALREGILAECEEAGVSLVGGDLSSSSHVVVSVTAFGDLAGREAVTRSGARPGDVVAVAGNVGLAGAGFAALSRGFRSPRVVVDEHLTPHVPYGQGVVAALAGASAMIDVSDGLVQDLGHIAAGSRVAIDVRTSAFEVPESIERVAAATGKEPRQFILAGGEDQALAATFAEGDVPEGWRVIGSVAEGEGVTVDGDAFETAGYEHFA